MDFEQQHQQDLQARRAVELACIQRVATTCRALTPSVVPAVLQSWRGEAVRPTSVRVGLCPDHTPNEYYDNGLFED